MWTMRLAKTEDYPFIARSYLRSNHGSPQTRAMIPAIYYPEYKSRLEYMVSSGFVLVACSVDDPDQILGFCIAGAIPAAIHYIYVKLPFRQLGIAKALAFEAKPDLGTVYTVVTHQCRNWNRNADKYKLVFAPQYSKETK